MIKPFLRSFLVHLFAIWLVSQNIGGISYNQNPAVLAAAAAALTLVNFFVRPILNFLLLPFNLITLGTFRWIVNVFTLYITTLLVPSFSVSAFTYPGLTFSGFVIPSFSFSGLAAYIVISLALSVVSSLVFWIAH